MRCFIPYDLESAPRTAHCICAEDIDRAIRGDDEAQRFIDDYGYSERERWRDLVVPFVEDPFEGRSFWSGRGAYTTQQTHKLHPRRGRGELFTRYERLLQKCGLAWNVNGGDQQHVIVARDSTPPLARVKDAPFQLQKKYGIQDGVSAIPINVHTRDVPSWTLNDEKLRAYVLHVCPNSNKSRRSRKRAALIVATAYLWFRALLSAEEIAEELGCTVDQVICRAGHIKEHGARLFGVGCDCQERRGQRAARTRAAA